ncbi:hypothetical protein SAMN06295912_10865 [Sphingomonas laterariae]|uniref:MetA-pathway of phenol degradation n=1 Tax=Edaphosphingomonas laterariae TaxID=861865 RepID=A0A239F5E8_9SPHN|nr:transporter [Sphingomonas laterariae]SNS51961.1 hypothetical protein SAMN06295912_10865 [Sphingomonas laterariae]
MGRGIRTIALATGCAVLHGLPAQAQSIEPRAYSPGPVGVNFLILGLSDSDGGLSIDPSLPVTNARLKVRSVALAYARTLDFWGTSGKVDVVLPYSRLSGSARFDGAPVDRRVDGLGDPTMRVSVFLHGAPALDMAAFRQYRQDFLVAASVQVAIPAGQYDSRRLINLGANRWSVKPEIGMSKTWGRWITEFSAAATFYGDNDDFNGGRTRSQDTLYAAQAHLVHALPSGPWIAADATYFTGGTTRIDSISDRNLQRNWRVGLTGALPVTRHFSIKANASTGVSARTGNNFDLIGLALQYRWGGGF